MFFFFFYSYPDTRNLHSFPTRRSSDLKIAEVFEAHSHRFCVGIILYHNSIKAASLQIKQLILNKISNRSEEHTSELQSRPHLVCRLLLEKKNNTCQPRHTPPNSPAICN